MKIVGTMAFLALMFALKASGSLTQTEFLGFVIPGGIFGLMDELKAAKNFVVKFLD